MDEANLADLVTTIADRLCGKHEHVCVALIRQLAAGTTWLHDHPDGIILPVADAHRVGRLLADHRAILARA